MPASYLTLRLTDGQTTLNLVDNTSYSLVPGGWSPAIAQRRTSQLGGYHEYSPVNESIQLMIYGDTAAEAIDNLTALANLLDQADSWALGDRVRPVLIEVQVQGSQLEDPLQSLVMGRAGDDQPMLVLPATFNDQVNLFEIGPVDLTFKRMGLWLGEEVQAEAAVKNNPSIWAAEGLPVTGILSPTTIEITDFSAATPMLGSGIIAVTGTGLYSTYGVNFGIFLPSQMTSGQFDIVNDAAHLALASNILRIDAASDQTGTITIPNVYAESSRLTVFAAVRSNHASSIWNVRAGSTGFANTQDRWQDVALNGNKPHVMYVGTLANQLSSHVNITLDFRTADSVGTLDLNYVMIFPYDASSRYIAVMGGAYSSAGYDRNLVINHRILSHTTPNIYIETAVD